MHTLRRRLRYLARAAYWIAVHRSFKHWRWVLAFAFGLIHGFGFASVLADLGLPQDALVRSQRLLGAHLRPATGGRHEQCQSENACTDQLAAHSRSPDSG